MKCKQNNNIKNMFIQESIRLTRKLIEDLVGLEV